MSPTHPRIQAVIPAHDEARWIGALLEGLRSFNLAGLLVVDDASTDGTAGIAEAHGAEVLRLAPGEGGGKGQALRAGIDRVKDREVDFILFMDGDGQHDPADLTGFLEHLARFPETDFIIGSRLQDAARIPKARWRTNALGTWILSRIAGTRWEDSQSGFRMIRRTLLRQLDLKGVGFSIEMEIAMKAADRRIEWAHVPIKAIYHGGGSHFRPLWDTLRIAFFSLRC